MNKRKIAVAVAGLGAVLVCASGAYFGIGASALLASVETDYTEPISYSNDANSTETTPSDGPASIDEPAGDLSPEAVTRINELLASIPSDWAVAEVDNAKTWLQQAEIITKCMDDAGFTYTYEAYWLIDPYAARPAREPMSTAEREREQLALYGNTGAGADYHWEDAGCHGYAVHVTGQDNAH